MDLTVSSAPATGRTDSSMAGVKVGHPWTEPLHARRREVEAARRAAAEAGWPEVDSTSVPAFFAGRSLLLTGATGFLGRLLLELLLRTSPDVEKVYVLMRPKRGVSVQERLRVAVANPLFDRLRAERPGVLEAKVHAVVGDINAPRLGLSDEDAALLCAEVAVFFNVAASVRFVEPLAKATLTNTRSAQEAVALAKAMPKLKAMVHVSTAYTNVYRPLLEEKVYTPEHDWRTMVKAAERISDPDTLTVLGPKLLGPQPNSYTFSKALAEQIIEEASTELPVVIVRPSIVVGTQADPIPGWIDNLYGFSVFWVLAGMGINKVHNIAGWDVGHNLIPGDQVAKAVVLAAWERGTRQRLKADPLKVVNCVASPNLCLTWREMQYLSKHVNNERAPMPDAIRYPVTHFVRCRFMYVLAHLVLHLAFGAVVDLATVLVGQKPRLLDIYRKMAVGLEATEVFQKKSYLFREENQWRLQSLLLPSDTKDYCNLRALDVRDDLRTFESHSADLLSGVPKYCLPGEYNPDKARARIQNLWWIQTGITVILLPAFLWILWRFCF